MKNAVLFAFMFTVRLVSFFLARFHENLCVSFSLLMSKWTEKARKPKFGNIYNLII